MAVFIPDIFSGYLNGMRQANTDNWNDLSNYNSVQQGQLKNAFQMATFDPAVRTAWNLGTQSDNKTLINSAATDNALRTNAIASGLGLPELRALAGFTQANNNYNLMAPTQALNLTNLANRQKYATPYADAQFDAYNTQVQQLKNNVNGTTATGSNPAALDPNSGSTNTGTTNNSTQAQQIFNNYRSGTIFDTPTISDPNEGMVVYDPLTGGQTIFKNQNQAIS